MNRARLKAGAADRCPRSVVDGRHPCDPEGSAPCYHGTNRRVGVRMAERVIKDEQPRVYFDCSKCPAYCCSVYERVKVTKRDIARLAKHFGVTYEQAEKRYT